MEEIILDTSVLIKLFSEDEQDRTSKSLLDNLLKESLSLVLIDLEVYELVNSMKLSKKLPDDYIIESISKLLETKPQIIHFSPELIKSALKIMTEFSLAVYDAIFIALAEIEKIPLLTADYKHHKKEISKQIVHYREWKI